MGTTKYGIQAFNKRGKSLTAEPPLIDGDREATLRRGERMAREKAGLIVYEVEVDDEIGDVDAPVILARYGEVPPAFAQSDIPY